MYVFANLLYIHYYHHNLKGIELMSRQKSERRNAVKTRIQSKEDLYVRTLSIVLLSNVAIYYLTTC